MKQQTLNEINFNWIKIQNFFSIGKEIHFDFSKHSGMNYVFGINKDIDTKNGCGKCVAGDTKIVISTDSKTFHAYKFFTNDVLFLNNKNDIGQKYENFEESLNDNDKNSYISSNTPNRNQPLDNDDIKFLGELQKLRESNSNISNNEILEKIKAYKEEKKKKTELNEIFKELNVDKKKNERFEFITNISSVVHYYSIISTSKDLFVLTPFGFKQILEAKFIENCKTPIYLRTFSDNELICSPEHRIKSGKNFIFAKDLLKGNFIETIKGRNKIRDIKYLKKSINLYDIQVEEVEQYYSNAIVSHNSTLFVDAPLFAIFNKTSKKVNKPSIPNRLDKKNSYVHINFSIGEDIFEIQSGITPNYFKLFKNDINITKPSPKETLEYIEKEIIKSSFLLFKYNIILSLSDTKNIFNMNKEERRRFIDSLFNILIIGKMYKNIKKDLNILDKELLLEQNTYNRLLEDTQIFKQKLNDFSKDKEINIQKITKNIEELQNKIKELIIEQVNTNIEDLKKRLDGYKEKFDSLVESSNKLGNNILLLNNDNSNKQRVIDKYKNILDIICKDCYAKVDNLIHLSEIINSQNNNNEKIKKINDALIILKENQVKLQSVIKGINREIEEYNRKMQLNKENEKWKNEYNKRINELNVELKEENDKISPFNDLLLNYDKKIEISNKKIDEFVESRKYLDFLIFCTSEEGIKKYLISDMINILNEKIKIYLEEMGCEYTAIFDPEFNCTFLTTTGECEYDNFSAGEKRRIDISITFAFKDLLYMKGLLKSNILVCDEILDSAIDDRCINAIIKMLKKQSETQTIYLVSHREILDYSDFDNIIELQKLNGVTTIISDEQGEK